ncbi:MAG: prepilin-type N-terminal cleavage/methylation domain-containing protein [Oscillospiraceae bacterium]
MKKNDGFTFIEIVVTITLISMMSAIGGVSYKGFDEFQNHRYAEKELKIIQDAYLYECANVKIQQGESAKVFNVDSLLPDEFIDKYRIEIDSLGYNITYYKNGNEYSLRGNKINNPDEPDKKPQEIVKEFTEDVKINMEQGIIDCFDGFMDNGDEIKFPNNDLVRNYVLNKVYGGTWPSFSREFCLLNDIPTNQTYYIQPMVFVETGENINDKDKKFDEKVVVFANSSSWGNWYTNYVFINETWFYTKNGVTVTKPYDELEKEIYDNPARYIELKYQ